MSEPKADLGADTLETTPVLPRRSASRGLVVRLLLLFIVAVFGANVFVWLDNRADPVVVPPPEGAVDHSLLFLGDVYTSENDLPGLVGRLMETGAPDEAEVWAGGYGARGHMLMLHMEESINGPLRAALPSAPSRPWVDTLVLQPNANMPMYPSGSPYLTQTIHAAGGLDALWALDGTQTYLMLGWGWRDGWRTRVDGQLTDYLGMQERMVQGTVFLSRGLSTPNRKVPIIPVGLAWAQVYFDQRGEDAAGGPPVPFEALYQEDGMTPSLLGSVLAAHVVYVALTGRSCIGLPTPVPGIPAPQLAYLQGVADGAVFDPLLSPGSLPPLPALQDTQAGPAPATGPGGGP